MKNIKKLPHYSFYFFKTLFSPPLLIFVLLGNLCLAAGATLFYQYEMGVNPNVHNLFDVIWWGLTTVTTVGYGDIIPVTVMGRVAGIFLMLTGLLLFIGFSALFVSIFFSYIEKDIDAVQKTTTSEFELVMKELKEIKESISNYK